MSIVWRFKKRSAKLPKSSTKKKQKNKKHKKSKKTKNTKKAKKQKTKKQKKPLFLFDKNKIILY